MNKLLYETVCIGLIAALIGSMSIRIVLKFGVNALDLTTAQIISARDFL